MTIPDPNFKVHQIVYDVDHGRPIRIESRLWNGLQWLYQYYDTGYNLQYINQGRIRLITTEEIR